MKTLIHILFLLCISAACNGVVNGVNARSAASESYDTLATGWYHVVGSGEGVAKELGTGSTYHLNPKPIVKASHFKTMTAESFPHDDTLWQVVVQLDEEGRKLFANATEELIGQDLAFVLNDSLWAEPIRIQAKIPNGVIVISKKGRFSKEEAEELRDQIEASKVK